MFKDKFIVTQNKFVPKLQTDLADIFEVEGEVSSGRDNYSMEVVYDISLILKFNTSIRIGQDTVGKVLNETIKTIDKQISHKLYGDFLDDILMLERSLYDKDIDVAGVIASLKEKVLGKCY